MPPGPVRFSPFPDGVPGTARPFSEPAALASDLAASPFHWQPFACLLHAPNARQATLSCVQRKSVPVHVMIRSRGTTPWSWAVESADGRRIGTITHAVGFGFILHAGQGTPLS